MPPPVCRGSCSTTPTTMAFSTRARLACRGSRSCWGCRRGCVALTDHRGFYSFDGLPPGTYEVQELQPEGTFDGQTAVGNVDGTRTGERTGRDRIGKIRLPSSVAASTITLGSYCRRRCLAMCWSIGGMGRWEWRTSRCSWKARTTGERPCGCVQQRARTESMISGGSSTRHLSSEGGDAGWSGGRAAPANAGSERDVEGDGVEVPLRSGVRTEGVRFLLTPAGKLGGRLLPGQGAAIRGIGVELVGTDVHGRPVERLGHHGGERHLSVHRPTARDVLNPGAWPVGRYFSARNGERTPYR